MKGANELAQLCLIQAEGVAGGNQKYAEGRIQAGAGSSVFKEDKFHNRNLPSGEDWKKAVFAVRYQCIVLDMFWK